MTYEEILIFIAVMLALNYWLYQVRALRDEVAKLKKEIKRDKQ